MLHSSIVVIKIQSIAPLWLLLCAIKCQGSFFPVIHGIRNVSIHRLCLCHVSIHWQNKEEER